VCPANREYLSVYVPYRVEVEVVCVVLDHQYLERNSDMAIEVWMDTQMVRFIDCGLMDEVLHHLEVIDWPSVGLLPP
jgi:hypothetical protein